MDSKRTALLPPGKFVNILIWSLKELRNNFGFVFFFFENNFGFVSHECMCKFPVNVWIFWVLQCVGGMLKYYDV